MKRFAFIFAALAAFAISCNKEVPETPEQSAPAGMKMVTITASVDEAATKTTYTPDGTDPTLLKFSWSKGDQISVWCSDSKFHTLTAESDGASATFSGMIPEDASLGWYAFYPADENHQDCKFSIPSYKDISATNSADIPMGAQVVEGVYMFKHMTAAMNFTFTNIPDNVETVDISFVNESMKFSGLFSAYISGDRWIWNTVESGVTDSERTYIRKVSVKNNTAQVHIPYRGKLWNGYSNTLNIVGYDENGNEHILLKDLIMPGKDLDLGTQGKIIPVAPYKIPVNLKNLDWNGSEAFTATVESSASYSRIKELNVLSDSENLYIRMIASLAEPFEGNYLDLFFCDGAASEELLWSGYWTTTCTNKYYYQHKGELDATGTITTMRFYTTPDNRVYVNTLTEISGNEAYWYFIYPLSYLEQYKSADGKLYVSAMLWKDWGAYGVIPEKDTSMLEVTLP